MKTITVNTELFLHQNMRTDEYMIYGCDMSEYQYVLVNTHHVDVEMAIPDGYDKTGYRIGQLKAEQQSIAGDAQIKMNNIEEQIQSLLAIEDHSEPTEVET
jgi:hypothetical protein